MLDYSANDVIYTRFRDLIYRYVRFVLALEFVLYFSIHHSKRSFSQTLLLMVVLYCLKRFFDKQKILVFKL